MRRAGLFLLIFGSAVTAPLLDVSGITFTGDRLLGLVALAVTVFLAFSGRIRWTPIHGALAAFVGVQVMTSLANATVWPQGLKFVGIYLLGFACFSLTAEWTAHPEPRDWAVRVWIVVGAILGLLGSLSAFISNLWQIPLWGSGAAQMFRTSQGIEKLVFAGKASFAEWNLLSSFLLIPFALGLWAWTGSGRGRWRRPWDIVVLGAIVFGLVFGLTRAAWVSMAGLIVLWWWAKRPRWRQVGTLFFIIALAFVVQAVAVGSWSHRVKPGSVLQLPSVKSSPLFFRVVEPIGTLNDSTIVGRARISRVTIQSWLERPFVGHGAGSSNRLSLVLPSGKRIANLWEGNLGLFVLHDSGLLGLAALLGLIGVMGRVGWRAVRTREDEAWRSVAVPLLGVGACLLFAYTFTHGMWSMYPYLYLGLLTATLSAPSGRLNKR